MGDVTLPMEMAFLLTLLFGWFLGRYHAEIVHWRERDEVAPMTPPVSEENEEGRYW